MNEKKKKKEKNRKLEKSNIRKRQQNIFELERSGYKAGATNTKLVTLEV